MSPMGKPLHSLVRVEVCPQAPPWDRPLGHALSSSATPLPIPAARCCGYFSTLAPLRCFSPGVARGPAVARRSGGGRRASGRTTRRPCTAWNRSAGSADPAAGSARGRGAARGRGLASPKAANIIMFCLVSDPGNQKREGPNEGRSGLETKKEKVDLPSFGFGILS